MRISDLFSRTNPFSRKDEEQEGSHNASVTGGNSCPSPFDYVSIRELYPNRLWSESFFFGNGLSSASTGRKYSFSGTMTEDDFLNCLHWAVPNRQRPVKTCPDTNKRKKAKLISLAFDLYIQICFRNNENKRPFQ